MSGQKNQPPIQQMSRPLAIESAPQPKRSDAELTEANISPVQTSITSLLNKEAISAPNPATSSNTGNMSGHLLKWTNYIKGYQRRWISINNGLLSYFRSPNEMDHTCRGAINLANATIHQNEDGVSFIVSNGTSNQTFHLRASNEIEKQKWINALELAKKKAYQLGHKNPNSNLSPILGQSNQNDSDDEDPTLEAEKNELENLLQVLKLKLNELSLSYEFVLKHSNALSKLLTELEHTQTRPEELTIKTINEQSTLYKVAMIGVMGHCQEFINLALFRTRKMNKILQSEREMRLRLEEMVQEMAKQQVNFETQLKKNGKKRGQHSQKPSLSLQHQQKLTDSEASQKMTPSTSSGLALASQDVTDSQEQSKHDNQDNKDDDEDQYYDDEFHDAVEDVTQFSVTLPRQKLSMHNRNPSNLSKLYIQESDMSSGDDDEQTIKVTMQTNKQEENGKLPNSTQSTALSATKKKTSSAEIQLVNNKRPMRQRRTQVPIRPNYSINLWSIMKNCIGKDLSKIPIPVNFSEPLSMLQRITEELEYSELLDQAAACEDQWEQMAYVAAFTITSYSTTANRTNKPFNPLLGETYEFDRVDDLGWRSLCEQVSHHPPGMAMHTESVKDWKLYQELTVSSKFRGQYLQVIPLGTTHLEFKKTGHHYTYRKIATFVRNIIVGKLWIDNVGEMDIINHKTKDVCHLKYFAYSYFSRDPPRKVTGIITDSNNVARYVLNGTWTEQIEGAPVLNPQVVTQQTQLNTGKSKILWKRRIPPAYLESMHNFTEFTVQLNEPEDGVAPTDSRLRPDQRLMEEGKWDEANTEKLRLEEKQRTARKAREQTTMTNKAEGAKNTSGNLEDEEEDINALTIKKLNSISESHDYEPVWFQKTIDPITKLPIHVFKNEYWEKKASGDWSKCSDIY
ncbi:oxysterol-binding 1 isoform X4 [Brachionus plicatilis]|uniref:Oxysterol-binding 1 isoform X4 n=1 Tax=Brachionus plicatilis TaxID=10195 RepID=A0A3M7Q9M0_BRAPC|nr:oxysterol-binding 1 isoform X4 [Brachionus plicatilis]